MLYESGPIRSRATPVPHKKQHAGLGIVLREVQRKIGQASEAFFWPLARQGTPTGLCA